MKTVYVNVSTFDVSMTQKAGLTAITTDLFDRMSDKDIEAQFYIPKGYSYIDPVSGEKFTGEYVRTKSGMATLSNLASIRSLASAANETANTAKDSAAANATGLDSVDAQSTYTAIMTSTIIGDGTSAATETGELSALGQKIKGWYDNGLWSMEQVGNAVTKNAIAAEEFKLITGQDFE